MGSLREIRANMALSFAEEFAACAAELGLTSKQLAAYCLSVGFQSVKASLANSTEIPLLMPNPTAERGQSQGPKAERSGVHP